MSNIQEKLDDTYRFIEKYREENGFAPSVREICNSLGIKSTATCHDYLRRLENEGRIEKAGQKKRAINVVDPKKAQSVNVPVIGTVTAGQPIFAYENLEEYCPLPKDFGEEDELFMLKVNGDSMKDVGILSGDRVIVRKQETATNGDIVVAYFSESATVKRFFKTKDKIVLHPENQSYADIILDDVTLLGKVVGLMRKF